MKTEITPESSRNINFKELFHYKDLFIILAWRDLKVRYAQTALGLAWAIIQPLATLLIFTLIFGRAIQVNTGDVPYPVYALAGMSAWAYFAFVMSQSGGSIISSGEMIKKIYFPRLIIPLSKAIVALVDFLVTLGLLIILMVYHQITVKYTIFLLPVFFLINVMASLAIGIWLSALTIRYRDFQHVIPFMVQIGLYTTPIAYPATLIPDKYQFIYHLNPMAGIVEGFRYAILHQNEISDFSFVSYGIVLVLFGSSIWYFKKMERTMADLV
ncbi:MAG: ABC transporter permease [Bacteroidota bacterium]